MNAVSERYLRPPVWGALRPDRFAATFATASPAGCHIALVGLADDLGIRMNGLTPGANEGPASFRRALALYATPFDGALRAPIKARVFDAGDVQPARGAGADALAETHRRVTETCAMLHDMGLTVVCVGGGHDLSFPAIRALAEAHGAPVGGINVDPHLDVRDRPCSGMPFRSLLDGGHLDGARFAEIGTGRFDNDADHIEFLREKGTQIHLMDEFLAGIVDPESILSDCIGSGQTGFVSIDLDVIDSSQAPGVSTPNPMGMSVADVVSIVEGAGRHPGVRHVDLMELCPARDVSERTARVAAHLFMTFVASLSERLG